MPLLDESKQKEFFAYIEEHEELYKKRLGEAVAIPSISSELDEHLGDINKMMDWTNAHIQRLGGKAEFIPNPASTEDRPLPPILLGEFLSATDPKKKKTLCVYGHLDVQPADISDGWDTDPFVLTEKDGKLFGRGSTDDKGPALSWLWVIEAFQALNIELPVNLKLMYEGMEEFGSDGLFEVIQQEAQESKFLSDVDFFCISDNYWLGKTKPCLTYGLRGLAYFELSLKGCQQDLHSGVFGGMVHEAMTDLIKLMSTLVNSDGTILVDGVYDSVKDVTAEEEAMYEPIDFDIESFKEEAKVITSTSTTARSGSGGDDDEKAKPEVLLRSTKKDLLMNRWRNPTLSLHGVEGAFSGVGAKTVIPAHVKGKFSLRLVPDQDPKEIEKCVRAHLEREFASLQSPNEMTLEMTHGAPAWFSNPKHPNFEAAAAAIQKVFGMEPDYTREGGSIPVTNAMEEATGGMNVCLLPIGACDDMAHSQNEKYNVVNMIKGIQVLGLYILELGNIPGPKPSDCRCAPSLSAEELMIPGAFVKGFKCKCEM
mmetsp:Transcript_52054/g.77739  ORF Transcript_52054/g.77739 Transcript_52054/m.77739 type:complete len:539 (-) Transcript_52054:406-2022(-)|eukprot:CAMPEP_0194069338 /NCGR_PEP_ID=MMETSP0009_2-20130614/87581_1 /TAXON_ID=210454 /ORGANISM="Grammatophora oceanica, Strain CCMP 410" /LENGTH=538 /DNA_ID=CAMNT_0038722513 /DNA_START=2409 /DNA_END=4025 /DNA_ORIENTATION=+